MLLLLRQLDIVSFSASEVTPTAIIENISIVNPSIAITVSQTPNILNISPINATTSRTINTVNAPSQTIVIASPTISIGSISLSAAPIITTISIASSSINIKTPAIPITAAYHIPAHTISNSFSTTATATITTITPINPTIAIGRIAVSASPIIESISIVAPSINKGAISVNSIPNTISITPITATILNSITSTASAANLNINVITPTIIIGHVVQSIAPIISNIRVIQPNISVSNVFRSTIPITYNITFGNHVVRNAISTSTVLLQSSLSNTNTKRSINSNVVNSSITIANAQSINSSYIPTAPSSFRITPAIPKISITTSSISIIENIAIVSPTIKLGPVYTNASTILINQSVITPKIAIGTITSQSTPAVLTIRSIMVNNSRAVSVIPLTNNFNVVLPTTDNAISAKNTITLKAIIPNNNVYCYTVLNTNPITINTNAISPKIEMAMQSEPIRFVNQFSDNVIQQGSLVAPIYVRIQFGNSIVDYYKMNFAPLDAVSVQPINRNNKYKKITISLIPLVPNAEKKGTLTGV